jgi:hypothetical protein
MQSVEELKQRVENIDLWAYSTNEDRCDNCRFYRVLKEDIGYCAHRDVDMVVGAAWWCKLWAPDAKTAATRGQSPSS